MYSENTYDIMQDVSLCSKTRIPKIQRILIKIISENVGVERKQHNLMENPKEATKKLLNLINNFSKAAGHIKFKI